MVKKILIFGATGLIGRSVTRWAVRSGFEVHAVVRSTKSADVAKSIGAFPIVGDMSDATSWKEIAKSCDAVVQAAAAFDGDPSATDNVWTREIVNVSKLSDHRIRVVYTGGCWLYPARIDPPITEVDDFDAIQAFQYMVDHQRLLLDSGVNLVTVHPGMVWSDTDGCTQEIERSIKSDEEVYVVGSPSVRWPMVHVEDLADLYLRAILTDVARMDFLGVGDPGVAVGEIIEQVSLKFKKIPKVTCIGVDRAVEEQGLWAAGLARSQRIVAERGKAILGWVPKLQFKRK